MVVPRTNATLSTRAVPKTTSLYWICQAAGWSAYLAYVLVGYFIWAPQHQTGDVISIVLFCTVIPVLMTHAVRRWMYLRHWSELSEWGRKGRMAAAAVLLAAAVTAAVGVANGLAHGRVWIPTEGMGWMFLAYWWAFGLWFWFYSVAHERRRRDELALIARDSQLRALRGQLNPHFLFNSLNSLRALIMENPDRAASMVTGLSEILRYSLASDRQATVSLAEELGVIDDYVDVERVRFEERLRIERSVDPRALDTQVPPMILQTLVENAVKHGISMVPGGGVVGLDAQLRDGRLKVVVSNTGKFTPSADNSGFGLQNAAERLRLLYGDRASLTITEELRGESESTVATLILPAESGR